MSIKTKNGKYGCLFCSEEFVRSADADSHQLNHEFILVPMLKGEISGLLQYIMQSDGDKSLITPDLTKRIKKAQLHKKNVYE